MYIKLKEHTLSDFSRVYDIDLVQAGGEATGDTTMRINLAANDQNAAVNLAFELRELIKKYTNEDVVIYD